MGLHRFLGPAGVVLLLFGLISYFLTLRFDPWTAVHVLGGAVLLLAAVGINLGGFRRTVTARSTREKAQALTGALLFGGILVTVNVLAVRHPWRLDTTENRIHTLSGQTRGIVAALGRPVEILAFFETGDAAEREVRALLERYAAESAQFTWRFIDAERDPQIAEQLSVRQHGVLVARSGETTAQRMSDPGFGVTEAAVTNLILKVTRPGPRTIYALTGHGEASPDDLDDPGGLGILAEALRNENLAVRTLLLSTEPGIPGDAAAVLVAGPRKALLEHEVEALGTYLAGGGSALMLLDPGTDPGLTALLADHGVSLGDDMIVDQQQIPFLGARLGLDPLVEDFPDHPITRGFRERILVLQARSVDVAPASGDRQARAQVVARTGAQSWAERDWRSMLDTGRVSEDPDDRPGPIPVAVASTRPAVGGAEPEEIREPSGTQEKVSGAEEESRVVVIGDSDVAVNGNLDLYFNREFLLNVIEWLAGREELIADRPRGLRPSRIDMTEADYRALFRYGVLLLPEVLVILGLGIWWRRRSL